jgi:SAM-dependent methyltransferase
LGSGEIGIAHEPEENDERSTTGAELANRPVSQNGSVLMKKVLIGLLAIAIVVALEVHFGGASGGTIRNTVQRVLNIGMTAQPDLPEKDVPYVPTPPATVDQMLRMAKVSSDDVVYDLGSGDGRIVIAAARDYGARGVGIDIDPVRIFEAEENAERAGVTDRVQFIQGDLFDADLGDATVVTLYLLTSVNLRLRPKLLAELKPGTPVVSHDFAMGEWEPDEIADLGEDIVYLWIVPADVHGRWRWNIDGVAHFATFDQDFQKVRGTLRAGPHVDTIHNARVDGDEVSFERTRRNEDGSTTLEQYRGRVRGDRIEGKVESAGTTRPWIAAR